MHSPQECLREPVAIPVFRINRRGIPPEDGSRLPERFEIHYTSKYVYPLNTSPRVDRPWRPLPESPNL
jgi:hypothetical protein